MTDKYQIGKNAAFLKILAIILMCLIFRGKSQSSSEKCYFLHDTGSFSETSFSRYWDISQLAVFKCPIFIARV